MLRCEYRPFDNWNQERVCWEGKAGLSIMEQIYDRKWQLISSEAIEVELERMRNLEKLENVLKLLEFATIKVNIDRAIDRRSQQLESLGFGLYDSFHIACAEMAQADVLISLMTVY